ncbi:hypothetical protein [Agaribacterium haliotis]|uniref:hypothetical protein n=1 Tax=Agaribacterium haliotis TaxID=2013869 RepID=UPI000BB5769F|nr:hypothetical protein [Agaribacterium haliotis]
MLRLSYKKPFPNSPRTIRDPPPQNRIEHVKKINTNDTKTQVNQIFGIRITKTQQLMNALEAQKDEIRDWLDSAGI